MRNLKLIFSLIPLLSISACLKEPNKDNNTKTKTQVVSQVEHYKTEIDSITNYEESQSSLSEIDKINFEIEDLISQLNQVLSENEMYGSIITILDIERGIFQLNKNYRFKIFDVILLYVDKDYFDGFGKHHLVLECSLREDCIKYTYDNGYVISVSNPIRSKEKCYEAIEIFEKIKEAYYKKNDYVSENH